MGLSRKRDRSDGEGEAVEYPEDQADDTRLVKALVAVGGCGDAFERLNSCEVYHPIKKTWTRMGPLSTRRAFVSTAISDGFLYVAGGHTGTAVTSSVERCPLSAIGNWSHVGSLRRCRADSSFESIGSKLYVIGGDYGTTRGSMDTIECYDQDTDSWSIVDGNVPPLEFRASCRFISISPSCCLRSPGDQPRSS